MPKDTSVSDLLPLVAAVFNDKAAADASEELQTAREERDASRRIEVIRSRNNGDDEDEDEEVVVYASGMFEDGNYSHNPNLWDVPMEKNSNNVCRLADLRDCHVCAGGGFPVASFGDNLLNINLFQVYIDGDGSDTSDEEGETRSDTCSVSFSFSPHTTWVKCSIHGWPREQWEQVVRNEDVTNRRNRFNFLVEEVAVQYPNTTIEFAVVTFVTGSIHGALKRLLPSERKEKVRADRDRRNKAKNPDFDDLYNFIARTMRERGNTQNRVMFMPMVYSIMGFLSANGVNRLGENDVLINLAIQIYEACGDEGLFELSERLELVNNGEDDGGTDEDEDEEEREEEENDNYD